MGHQTLKTVHDTETGEPVGVKYDGELVYMSFVINTVDASGEPTSRVAVLDTVATYDFDEVGDKAYIDLDAVQRVTKLVENVPYIDRVSATFHTHD